ncbi:MAG: sulfurtransferase-like selenium metabolism protein YedF [Deltaproteobacteria bacterium]|nr:sulfurtransferase-like selenium metabolism protein YedF [Deltaproteobacteria bacterium]MBW2592084.1 sulfurtransferase-like selenium metabolism protein YedF [Deltaproteobacteria bacterium]
MQEIDARGLACPAPVLQTKKAIEENNVNSIRVLVDNEAAMQNVNRFLTSQGFGASIQEKEGGFYVTGSREDRLEPENDVAEKIDAEGQKIMVMVGSDCMGHGDAGLGSKLMVSFLKTLKEMGTDLWRLIFVNNGVKLAISDSEVLPVLKEYEKEGLCILVCGTCLTHFNLMDQKQVGETTNMLDIVTAMQLSDKVINI